MDRRQDERTNVPALLKIIDEAKAGGCVDCGLIMPEHLEVFDFDHTSGDKIKNVSAWLTTGTEEDLRAEIARCEVVCANCHRIRSASRPHGSRGRDGRKPSRTMVDPAWPTLTTRTST